MWLGWNIGTGLMIVFAVVTLAAAKVTWPHALRERVSARQWLARGWLLIWAAFGIGGAAATIDLKLAVRQLRGPVDLPPIQRSAPPATPARSA